MIKRTTGIASAALHLDPDKSHTVTSQKIMTLKGLSQYSMQEVSKCQSQMVSFDPQQIRIILKHIFTDNKRQQAHI
jgi:hypothetical protein